MKLEIRTLTLILCAALTLVTACQQTLSPSEDPQPSVVDFRASSQATWVKSASTTFSDYHSDFGVWGIARQGNLTYNLWGYNTTLVQVTKNASNSYVPTVDAYWLSGYVYNFLAVAPYNDSGMSSILATPAVTSETEDVLKFNYDLTSKYTATTPIYTFDLLGAAAETDPITGGRTDSQDLKFWHLFSQINLTIKFGKDGANNGINGKVKAIRFSPEPKASFEISYDSSSTEDGAQPIINTAVITQTQKPVLEFTTNVAEASVGPINIVPQAPANILLEVDITIQEDAVTAVDYTLTIDLNAAQAPEKYLSNNKYNYTITIGTKAAITFDVSVNNWETPEGEIPEIDM